MSANEYISIINGNMITVNVNDNDVWSLNVINANFMLDNYSGRGKPTNPINIISFPNLGDGLFGEIEIYVNNYQCFKSSISNISHDLNSYFTVTPKHITLNGKDSTSVINVSSDCNWDYEPKENNNFSISMGTNNLTITSRDNNLFEYEEIIVTNCNGLTETVYVSQKEINTTNNILEVSPQYIELNGDNLTFTINVISICNGSTDYTYNDINGININKQNNIINGEINNENGGEYELIVNNECSFKTVKIKYSKQSDNEKYLWITKENRIKEIYRFTADTSVSYDILSSSNWYIYSYDSTKVRCSKSGDKIIVSLGEDRTECNSQKIIIKNKDNCEVTIEYSIGSGLTIESGITFSFYENENKVSSITRNNIELINNEYKFTACVLAYDNNNKPIEWQKNKGEFDIIDINGKIQTYQSGGTSGSCKTVTFKLKESEKNSIREKYYIELNETDTGTDKTISINVTLKRSEIEIKDGYNIKILPEDGTVYTYSNKDNIQIKVTPTYYYNDNIYYIGENDENSSLTNYKGVSAKTTSSTVNLTYISTNSKSITYKVEGITTDMTSFTVCTTATTKYNDIIEPIVSDCTTIYLSGSTSSTVTSGETTEYELQVSDTSIGECDTTASPTVQGRSRTIISESNSIDNEVGDWSSWSVLTINTDYTLSYNPSLGINETDSQKTYTVTATGSGNYVGLSDTATVTQDAGPCDMTGVTYQYDLQVSNVSIGKCDTTASPTVQGRNRSGVTHTTSTTIDWSDVWTSWSDLTLDTDYKLSYNPSLTVNNTDSQKTYTVTATGEGNYSGLTKTATVTQDAGPCSYCEFLIAKIEGGVTGEYSTSVSETYEADDNDSHYLNLSTKSRYYTSETEYERVDVTISSDRDWIPVNTTNNSFEVLDNETTSQRTGTVTFTQNGEHGCNLECYVYITQKGRESSCMVVNYTVSGLDSAVTVYFKTTNGTQQDTHTVSSNDSMDLCNIANGTELVVSCSDTNVTVGGDTSFTYSDTGGTINITLTKPTATIYEYTFTNCYSDREIGLFASDVTPSGSHTQYAMLSALDGTSVTVNVNSLTGMPVNGSSSSDIRTVGINDTFKVYSVNSSNSWSLEDTITLVAENKDFTYGNCSSCDCDEVSISCSPRTGVTTGNSVSTTISLTVGDNCDNSWSAYRGSEFIMSGTGSTFSATQLGTVTIKSNACPEKTTTFEIVEPVLTGLNIWNNEPGSATVTYTVNNTQVKRETLDTTQSGQTQGSIFSGYTVVNIEYGAGTWVNGRSGWVAIDIDGTNLVVTMDTENGINIDKNSDAYWVSGAKDGSCSGSINTVNGIYTVTINIIFASYPYSN